MSVRFLRLPEVLRRRGVAQATHYRDICDGLWTKGVKIGKRAVAWPKHESDELLAARLRGDSERDVRALVERLHQARLHLSSPQK